VDDAEDRRAGADTDGERDDGDRRVQGRATQRPQAVRGILTQLLPEIPSVHLVLDIVSQDATLVAQLGKVTKTLERGCPRCLGRKSFTFEPAHEHRDMLLQLVIDLLVDRWSPEQLLPGAEQLSHAQAGLSTRAIAFVMMSHCADCARSSARPDGVSV
jgi:hypothetical protein